jgi:hypothetical protein
MQYWLAFSWPYNLLSDKVLRITVYSCTNDVPVATQTRLSFDVILPLWGRRGPR